MLVARDPAPSDALERRDALERVRGAIHELPETEREVFLLRAQQDTAYAEIATVLGTTPGAARVHFHHAVKALKRLIG